VPVIDSDQLAREVVMPGQPGLDQIAHRFGKHILLPDGSLDRPQLRRLVFADDSARRALENILHPRIRALMLARLAEVRTPYAILAIPLLLETGRPSVVDRVLVVDCSEAQQMERAGKRDGVAAAKIPAIMQAQVSRAERLAAADDILDNSGAASSLNTQVETLHRKYLRLAAQAPRTAAV